MVGHELLRSGKCSFCDKRLVAPSDYCIYHERAYSEVKSGFSGWVVAFENLSWERYLETIIGLKETGVWAAEVAKIELRCLREGLISNQLSEDKGSRFHGD